jgi:hypothetical protein
MGRTPSRAIPPETLVVSGEAMAQSNVTAEELGALIERVAATAKSYIAGDMRTYFSLILHSDDYTLMSPFGGEPERGVDTSPEHLDELSGWARILRP